jgi:sugar lactone lactonase YvrE
MKRVSFASTILFFFVFCILAYPQTATDQAMLEQGIQLKNQGKFIEAFDTLSRIRIRYPGSALLPLAEYQMGLTSLYDGRPVEAAIQLQKVITKFPNSPESKLALNLNSILYRLYIAPASNTRIFNPDSSFSAMIADLDEPVGMGIDSERKIYLTDRGKKVLYTLDSNGKMVNSTTVLSPYNISVTKKNDVLVGNDSTVYITTSENVQFPRINPQTQARMGYLEQIRSVATNDNGQYFVISGKLPGVAVYDAQRSPQSSPSFGREAEYNKVLVDSRNNVLLLSRRGDSLSVFDPDGKSLFALTKTGRELTFGKINDFAVDHANHIYLLTDNPRGIAIYSPQGKFLRFIAAEKNTPLFLDDPKLIVVGPAGSIYVLDKGTKRIVKFG